MTTRRPLSIGVCLLVTAGLHLLVGVVEGARPLLGVVLGGWVGAVEPDAERRAAFWFLVTGVVLLGTGELLRLLERAGPVPARFGWALLALGLAGGLAIPASGFWLLVPQGAILLRRAYAAGRDRRAPNRKR